MIDPVRLLEGKEITSFERDLLESARHERPSAETVAVLLSGLSGGLDVAAGTPSTTFDSGVHLRSDHGASLNPAGMRPDVPLGPSLGVGVGPANWALGIWGSAGLGLGGLAVIAFLMGGAPTRSTVGKCDDGAECQPRATRDSQPDERFQLPKDQGFQPAPSANVEGSRTSTTHRNTVPEQPAVRSRASAQEEDVRASLTQEVVALEPARVALRDRDGRLALRVLSRYSQRFPNGSLKPEAEAMRVQARALVAAGSRSTPRHEK